MIPSILMAILLVLLGPLCYLFIHHRCTTSLRLKLPPSPPTLPIIGNLHMLGSLPHRSLYRLAKKYGDIMSLRLGYVPTIVVSSPQAAKLFLKTHDAICASRPKVQASEYLCYGSKGLVFAEYGPYWRNIRRLCTVELLSTVKIESFSMLRREELGLLIESFKKSSRAVGQVMDVSAQVGELIEDVTYKMVFGRCRDERFDMKAVFNEGTILAGAFNIADYVPWIGVFDLQGLTRRLKATSKVVDNILEKIIDEHEQDAKGNNQRHHRDFIDVMLSLLDNSHDVNLYKIDRSNIKAIILDVLAGAIDTTAIVIEWALAELLKHPRVMRRLQEELESVIGLNRMVEEKDLPKLIYLNMVIKESHRLHPVAPLLGPHESMEDIMIDEYYNIPKKSRIIVNVWAIGRDPNVWSDNAEEFFPERFMSSDIDVRGHDFQLLPFGSGRRGCPGMQLGLTTVGLVLAQLVHCFDWELPNCMLPNELDMSEKFGLLLPRANHLLAVPTYRLLVKNL